MREGIVRMTKLVQSILFDIDSGENPAATREFETGTKLLLIKS
jgi:hypothetical protein